MLTNKFAVHHVYIVQYGNYPITVVGHIVTHVQCVVIVRDCIRKFNYLRVFSTVLLKTTRWPVYFDCKLWPVNNSSRDWCLWNWLTRLKENNNYYFLAIHSRELNPISKISSPPKKSFCISSPAWSTYIRFVHHIVYHGISKQFCC